MGEVLDLWALVAFLPAALALNLTPGADMLFCLGQGLRVGARSAVAASAGISVGAMVHVTLAGVGLGALVAAHPVAFDVIRWVGVLYLIWLAQRSLRAPLAGGATLPESGRFAFRDGLIVNLSNPKVILFVLAFIPQFLDPDRATLPQFLVYGAVLALGGFVINGCVGIFAGGIGQRLLAAGRFERGLRWVTATLFGALAVRLAVGDRI